MRAFLVGLVAVVTAALASCRASSGDGSEPSIDGMATGGAPNSVGGSSSAGADATGGSGPVPGNEAIDCRTEGDGKTTLVFVNRCAGTLEYAGSDIAGGTLEPGQFRCVDIGSDVEPLNAKRYWGWIGENPGAGRHSLAEFTFNTDFHDFDWYNISYVDAFNLPMQIVPVARPDCETLTCSEDLLPGCPDVGVHRDSTGTATSCVSPDRNDPESPVARYFEQCDDAYAWSGDDQHGSDPSPVRACAGEDWDIVFCPEE